MRRWLPASIIAGAWIFSIAIFAQLPADVPVHWGMSGEPNRYGSRLEGAFLMPAIMLALYVAMQWYPPRDPRASNIAKFRETYDTVVTGIIAFLGIVHVIALGNPLGWPVDMTTAVFLGLGVLLLLLGNLMPRVRSNFIFGIRTPWTLSSETVWTRAHRLGGYAMVAAGIITLVSAFLARPIGLIISITSALLSGLIPVVYSYLLWSREHGGPSGGTS